VADAAPEMKLASYTDDLPAGGDAIIVLEETDFG
jgi:hypothetical protein